MCNTLSLPSSSLSLSLSLLPPSLGFRELAAMNAKGIRTERPFWTSVVAAAASALHIDIKGALKKFDEGVSDTEQIERTLTDTEREQLAANVQVFNMFDTDGDGTISIGELKGAFKQTGELQTSDEEFEALLAHIDADGDGTIDFDEFSSLMAKVVS